VAVAGGGVAVEVGARVTVDEGAAVAGSGVGLGGGLGVNEGAVVGGGGVGEAGSTAQATSGSRRIKRQKIAGKGRRVKTLMTVRVIQIRLDFNTVRAAESSQ
jgi:hypothetical protein